MWILEPKDNIKLELLRFFIIGLLTILIIILLFIIGSSVQILGCIFAGIILIAVICVIGLIVHIILLS
jgi:hypothetical protein